MVRQVFTGSMIHAHDNGEVIFQQWVTIFVDDGKIVEVMENRDQQMIDDFQPHQRKNLLPGQFMIPGFIDCHTYAVQFPNIGLGYDKTLLGWLETYAYPLEKMFSSNLLANRVFEQVVNRTLAVGITTACYSAALYTLPAVQLAQFCSELGQRAFVGKICMNAVRDDGYYETTQNSIQNTRLFIDAIHELENPLVQPIITPRNALSCDMELLRALSDLAVEKHLRIQSNISQDPDEIAEVTKKFKLPTYTDVYSYGGILSNTTILAHGNVLSDNELKTLTSRGTTIIHCPTSNLNLKSGLCDVRNLKRKNIVVGLGTDISGGSNYSILDEMRSALHVSNALSFASKKSDVSNDYVPLDYKDVFFMATLGGAKALSISDKVGNFEVGKEFDALFIDLNAERSFVDNFREYTLQERLQKFIYSGTFHNIISIYVKGIKIK